MKNTYPGNSREKKAARARLYRALPRLAGRNRRDGILPHAVIFAGYGCPELASLRRAGWSDDQIVIIDRDPECRADARRRAPRATVAESVSAACDYLNSVDGGIWWANMDIMGAAHAPKTRAELQRIGWYLMPGAVVALTYLRGREAPDQRGFLAAFRALNAGSVAARRGWGRWQSVTPAQRDVWRRDIARNILKAATGGSFAREVVAFDYIGSSPMGVIALQFPRFDL